MRAWVRRQAAQAQPQSPQHRSGMLAGEVRRIEPGCNRECLLYRISATADLDIVISDLTGLCPADGTPDVGLAQVKGMTCNLRVYRQSRDSLWHIPTIPIPTERAKAASCRPSRRVSPLSLWFTDWAAVEKLRAEMWMCGCYGDKAHAAASRVVGLKAAVEVTHGGHPQRTDGKEPPFWTSWRGGASLIGAAPDWVDLCGPPGPAALVVVSLGAGSRPGQVRAGRSGPAAEQAQQADVVRGIGPDLDS